MEELGEWSWLFTFHYSNILQWQGDPVAAELEVRPAYDALKRIGEKSHFSTLAHALALAVYLQGRYEEAEQLTKECEEAARPNDVQSQIIWRSTRAKVLARRGEFEAADRFCVEAMTLAEGSDFLTAHAEALMDVAEVAQLSGRTEEARDRMADAIRYYEQKGNVLAADRARALLAELR
jgi:tetratricopeptide (TPR) repeat protein